MPSVSRFSCRSVLSLLLALPLVVALTTHAGAAVPEPPPSAAVAPAVDSGAFLPRWLRFRGSVGYGWISAPTAIRQHHEAGQAIELGVEAQLRPRLRFRVNGEYQVLPAMSRVDYAFIWFEDVEGGTLRDTISVEARGRGWLGSARAELQWRALPHTWLLAGAGRGYLSAGLRAYHYESPFETLDIDFPGSSGWAWTTSLGARDEFDVFGPLLGAEVRWTDLARRQDNLQTWSIRIGW